MPTVQFKEADLSVESDKGLSENLMVAAAAVVFGGGTLFFIVFMLFELAGNPLF